MSETSEIIRSILNDVKSFTDVDSIIGSIINTPSGMSIIPVSKISVGFLGGGADYAQKKLSQQQSFAGGSGAGISISPIAFLTISPDSVVRVISLNNEGKSGLDRVSALIDRSPEIIDRIKKSLS